MSADWPVEPAEKFEGRAALRTRRAL